MDPTNRTVLITGGASGIGLALAERFVAAGSQVLVCGRRPAKLQELKARLPEIHTFVCDIEKEGERQALLETVTAAFPNLDVLVNNAGIQQRVQLTSQASWPDLQQEIKINFEAPVHLCTLFIPHLLRKAKATIINVTSGLSFAPLASVPIYSATKAALHSFTLSLRYQLSATSIDVVELIPPAVKTDLGGPGLHSFGVDLDAFADWAFKQLREGEIEVTYGSSEVSSQASRTELQVIFNQMNQPRQ